MRVVVVGDSGDSDPGWVGERLVDLGATLVPVERDDLEALRTAGATLLDDPLVDLLLLLGSARSVDDESRAGSVEAESALARTAREVGVPAIGICYGSQLLAYAHGGSVGRAEYVELGRLLVESTDAVLCPPGPWLQFHSDAFTAPEGARLLGSSGAGPQGFVLDPVPGVGGGVVAWQFHPETTPDMLRQWVADDAAYVAAAGRDPDALVREADATASDARRAAFALTDAALERLAVRPRTSPARGRGPARGGRR